MPGTMFQELVSPRARARGNWYTLPLSFLAHTAIIAILVVVPLIATDVLPMPRMALQYINSDFTPVVPAQPPPAPRRDATPPSVGPAAPSVPVVAPDGIGVENGVIIDQGTIATQPIDGVIGGLGTPQNVVEAPPVVAPPVVPVRPGGLIKPPVRTRYVAPEYPEMARRNRVEGTGDHRGHHRYRWQDRECSCAAIESASRQRGARCRACMGIHADAAERQPDAGHHDDYRSIRSELRTTHPA